jgi:hypothetical protein
VRIAATVCAAAWLLASLIAAAESAEVLIEPLKALVPSSRGAVTPDRSAYGVAG